MIHAHSNNPTVKAMAHATYNKYCAEIGECYLRSSRHEAYIRAMAEFDALTRRDDYKLEEKKEKKKEEKPEEKEEEKSE